MVSGASPALKKVGTKAATLVDLAYGGSMIENNLAGTWASSPAAKDQVAQFLADTAAGGARTGRALMSVANDCRNRRAPLLTFPLKLVTGTSTRASTRSPRFGRSLSALG